jgi:hypothetical protein
MEARQGTVTIIAESAEAALAWLRPRYRTVHSDAQGVVWSNGRHLVYEDADGVTLTFRPDVD